MNTNRCMCLCVEEQAHKRERERERERKYWNYCNNEQSIFLASIKQYNKRTTWLTQLTILLNKMKEWQSSEYLMKLLFYFILFLKEKEKKKIESKNNSI